MLAAERRARILAEVDHHGSVRVSELVPLLGVSDMTVRRDLAALHDEGQLCKVHGGATRRVERGTDEPGFAATSRRQRLEKEAIAQRAAALLERGYAVALSAGSTTYALARHLAHVPGLTVVTNSVRIADLMHATARDDCTLLLTGGIRTPSDALVGALPVAALRSLHTDVTFAGCHGMDVPTGFTSPNLLEAETNRALVATGGRLVVVADSTKWGEIGLSSYAELSDADVVVTDSRLGAAARHELEQKVGELVVVDRAVRADRAG